MGILCLQSWVTGKVGDDWITDLMKIKDLETYADSRLLPEGIHEY